MDFEDKIIVIKEEYSHKIKVKGSTFLGFSFRVSSADEAENKLTQIRKEHFNATHHCYAFKISGGKEKYSDDGEPSGTAGIRIMNVINRYRLTEILVVIVRYFGGTKLGVGPLGKAYRDATDNLFEGAEFIELTKFEKIRINYNYDSTNSIHFLLNKFGCRHIENGFDKMPFIYALIHPMKTDNFIRELKEKTSGNAVPVILDEHIYLRFK